MEWGRSSCVWCTSTSFVGVDDVCVVGLRLTRLALAQGIAGEGGGVGVEVSERS